MVRLARQYSRDGRGQDTEKILTLLLEELGELGP